MPNHLIAATALRSRDLSRTSFTYHGSSDAYTPNSAIEFLVLPVDAPKRDRGGESMQETVNLIASMSIGSLFSVLLVHFGFLRASLTFPQRGGTG